jgi:hypothetical protein
MRGTQFARQMMSAATCNAGLPPDWSPPSMPARRSSLWARVRTPYWRQRPILERTHLTFNV